MSSPTPPPDIPKTLGAMLIGALFASVFSGISDLQAMFYFKSYKHDPLRLKLLVSLVWIMDTIHLGFIWGALWFYLIGEYGLEQVVNIIAWEIPMIVIQTVNPSFGVFRDRSDDIQALIVFFVDYFYANRIFVLSKGNWFLTAPVMILMLLRLGKATNTRWLFTLSLSVSAALDAATSGSLVYLPLKHRVENGRYNRVLDKLILYGLECGSLTCLGSITTMLSWVLMRNNLIFCGMYFCIGKFYANVLFATLNSRHHVLRGTPIALEPRMRTSDLDNPHTAPHPIEFGPEPSNKVPSDKFQISVHMERTVHYEEGDSESQRSQVPAA
ncbi:hypothetical protein FB45DRAFT_1094420 [Roridomyces roridus]|uniref:DUF6534 domain-containing protein n=1 Tax=Roridomyces roridus TaxID=1738132 RepID=A0AAD7FIA6_9AGAR|nr:hypothetical protein FB45DRAFT_1094420 [Roridomyces roridus]